MMWFLSCMVSAGFVYQDISAELHCSIMKQFSTRFTFMETFTAPCDSQRRGSEHVLINYAALLDSQ